MFKPVEVDEGHKSTNYRRILHIETGIEVIGDCEENAKECMKLQK